MAMSTVGTSTALVLAQALRGLLLDLDELVDRLPDHLGHLGEALLVEARDPAGHVRLGARTLVLRGRPVTTSQI
jgi:hypothetical protein